MKPGLVKNGLDGAIVLMWRLLRVSNFFFILVISLFWPFISLGMLFEHLHEKYYPEREHNGLIVPAFAIMVIVQFLYIIFLGEILGIR